MLLYKPTLLALASLSCLPSTLAWHGAPARAANNGVVASIPLSAPSSAPTLSQSLVSFSIEGDRWPEWVGVSQPNTFFISLLKNLGSITGRMPDVRVGANSEDRTTLDETVNVVNANFGAPTSSTPYPEAYAVNVSSTYYSLSKWLPKGTHVIWGVNFGNGTVQNAAAMAQSIANAFSAGGAAQSAGVILDAIQIGNEPDLYARHGNRSATYNIQSYLNEWETFAEAIIPAANLQPGSAPRIWLGGFSSSSTASSGAFSAQNLFAQGVLTGPYGDYVDTFSQHHYQSSVCADVHGPLADIQSFMAKSTVRSNITKFSKDISATASNGLTYILGETNSISCHGAPGVSNTAAAAIWAIDYVLQAAVQGIQRVYFHNGIGYKYNLIQPVHLTRSPTDGSPTSLDPHIQPQYYAAIVVANFIGSSPSTSIVEIQLASQKYISGYAAYDANGQLARAVFINSKAHLSTSSSRGSVTLDLDFAASNGGTPPKTMRIRRLAIGFADDTSGLKLAGRTYETNDGLVSGKDHYVDAPVGAGLKVSDTEAVLVTFVY